MFQKASPNEVYFLRSFSFDSSQFLYAKQSSQEITTAVFWQSKIIVLYNVVDTSNEWLLRTATGCDCFHVIVVRYFAFNECRFIFIINLSVQVAHLMSLHRFWVS